MNNILKQRNLDLYTENYIRRLYKMNNNSFHSVILNYIHKNTVIIFYIADCHIYVCMCVL